MQAREASALREPYQYHLPMFPAHVIEAADLEEMRRKAKKRKARKKVRPGKEAIRRHTQTRDLFESIDERRLDLPLGGPASGNELNCAVDPTKVCELLSDELEEEAEVTWTDEEIEQLHEAVLHYSLKLLQARGNGAEKKEILQWIFAPDLKVAQLKDGDGDTVEILLPQFATPFSFEQCCRICGYSPDRLQEELEPILVSVGLGNVFKEILHATE